MAASSSDHTPLLDDVDVVPPVGAIAETPDLSQLSTSRRLDLLRQKPRLESGLRISARQHLLLLRKNARVIIRNPFNTFCRLLFAPLLLFALWALAEPSRIKSDAGEIHAAIPIGPLPTCSEVGLKDCITLMYSPASSKLAYDTMAYLAKSRDPPFSIGSFGDLAQNYDIVAFKDFPSMSSHVVVNSSLPRAIAGVGFDCKREEQNNYPGPFPTSSPTPAPTTAGGNSYPDCDYAYPGNPRQGTDSEQIVLSLVNFDDLKDTWTGELIRKMDYSNELMLSVLNAVEKIASSNYSSSAGELKVKTRQMTSNSFYTNGGGTDLRATQIEYSLLCPMLLIGFWVFYLNAQNVVTYERLQKLRDGLRMMGLQNGPFWNSFVISEGILALLCAAIVTIVGYFLQFTFFYQTPVVAWLATSLFGLNVVANGLLLAAVVHRPFLSNFVMCIVFLFALAVCALVGSTGGTASTLFLAFYNQGMTWWSYMGFVQNFCMIVGIVQTDVIFLLQAKKPLDGVGFSSKLGETDSLTVQSFLGVMVLDFLGAWFLAWYLDSCWPGKTGIPLPISFPFNPYFWGLVNSDKEPVVDLELHDAANMNTVLADLDSDIAQESTDTIVDCQQMLAGRPTPLALHILKLSKTYKGGRIRGGQDCRALDMLTTGGEKGSVFCLLGHNGSGKTTTISCLTGLISPSFGDAFLFGHSISQDIATVRTMLGVCPQENILWPDMTCGEHIAMFARLRGVRDVDAEVRKRLEGVQLLDVKDRLIGTLSGGMKRRLSFAIANVGDPDCIFLDEPTAGLDPGARRHIWNAIKEAKKNRFIVLTTHSLFEADSLGDKIAILALGRLRAVGSSLHLKKRFGVGFHVTITTDPERQSEVTDHISDMIPNASLDTTSAGAAIYTIPTGAVAELRALLMYLEKEHDASKDEEQMLIKDWGVSETTLEEVFLRVTHGSGLRRDQSDQDAESLLNIGVEGGDVDDIFGSVRIKPNTTLLALRDQIRDDVLAKLVTSETEREDLKALAVRLRDGFCYVAQGVALHRATEATMYASDFSPLLEIRPMASLVGPSGELHELDAATLQIELGEAKVAIEKLEVKVSTLTEELKEEKKSHAQTREKLEEALKYKSINE